MSSVCTSSLASATALQRACLAVSCVIACQSATRLRVRQPLALAALHLIVSGSLCAVQVSLNLMHVCDYGTLEFRGFESSFDASRLVSWAHF